MDVLQGAHALLNTSRVRYLTFEYHQKWFTAGRNRTLHSVVEELFQSYGFACYLIMTGNFIPLFDIWWDDICEFRQVSDIFCARKEDLLRLPFEGLFDESEFCPYFYCWT